MAKTPKPKYAKKPKNKHYLIFNRGNRIALRDLCDCDEYSLQLSYDEKTFLANFIDFYYLGNAKAGNELYGRTLTDAERKACYKRNNDRNKDMFCYPGNVEFINDNELVDAVIADPIENKLPENDPLYELECINNKPIVEYKIKQTEGNEV